MSDIHCEIRRIRLLSKIYEMKKKSKPCCSYLKTGGNLKRKLLEGLIHQDYQPKIKVTDEIYEEECEELFQVL